MAARAGVDAAKRGWVGIVLDADGGFVQAVAAATITAVVEAAGRVGVVAVDMPIGLPDATSRKADAAARRIVGPRRSSVFPCPTRPSVEAGSYEAAAAAQGRAVGVGLSRQTWGLHGKLLKVDLWVRGGPGVRVVEAHPEVSFAEMNGSSLAASKHS